MDHGKKMCVLRLVGRILISFIFIVAGLSKIGGFAAASAWTGTVLPFPDLFTALTIVLEVVGGLMILVGFKTKIAAWALAIFTVLAAFLFHFDFADQIQSGMFMKNLAIAGGFLFLIVTGPGRYSLDARMEKKSASATPSM